MAVQPFSVARLGNNPNRRGYLVFFFAGLP